MMIAKNSKEKNDPSVEELTKMFSDDFLKNAAIESGFIQRWRKINPVIFFWVLVLGFGVNFLREIRGLKRKYEIESNTKLSISSFNDRFTAKAEDFFKKCIIHALEYQTQEHSCKLRDKLKNFKDILIQDSTIIRLHESLAKLFPAARSKKIAAGLKLSCVISCVAESVKTVRIFSERRSEVKTLRLREWVKGCILLIDLGFFKYAVFDRIEYYGGFFVSRLKGNANPKIVGVNRKVW
jgi:hypothetical protein